MVMRFNLKLEKKRGKEDIHTGKKDKQGGKTEKNERNGL